MAAARREVASNGWDAIEPPAGYDGPGLRQAAIVAEHGKLT